MREQESENQEREGRNEIRGAAASANRRGSERDGPHRAEGGAALREESSLGPRTCERRRRESGRGTGDTGSPSRFIRLICRLTRQPGMAICRLPFCLAGIRIKSDSLSHSRPGLYPRRRSQPRKRRIGEKTNLPALARFRGELHEISSEKGEKGGKARSELPYRLPADSKAPLISRITSIGTDRNPSLPF